MRQDMKDFVENQKKTVPKNIYRLDISGPRLCARQQSVWKSGPSLANSQLEKCPVHMHSGADVTRKGQWMTRKRMRNTIKIDIRARVSPPDAIYPLWFEFNISIIHILGEIEIECCQHCHNRNPQ